MFWHCGDKNLNFKISDKFGKQLSESVWDGEYATYWNDGAIGAFFQEAIIYPSQTNGWVKSEATRTVTVGASNGGTHENHNGYEARSLTGKIQAVRIYGRALTEDELRKNRIVDNARFKGIAAEWCVLVTSNHTGVEGEEACGNMIICVAALAHIEGNAEFAGQWWPLITKWVHYLERFGFDPGNQLCTDDFAGHLAHNANLAVKSIVAIACYGRLSGQLGDQAAARKYTEMAKAMVPKWMEAAKGGAEGGYRLAYDRPGTWSMKYNLVWDKVLGLDLFPRSVFEAEVNAYSRLIRPFGLPLDNRRTWTKTDWELWCACLTDSRRHFDLIVDSVYRFADETPSRVPFSDWYWTDNSRYIHFIGRSVIGGVFMPMLCDASIWKKYAARDKAKTGLYAPIDDGKGKFETIVPEGRADKTATWKYTFSKPPAGWEKSGFDDSSWETGRGGFGTHGTPGAVIGTKWSTPAIWLRHATCSERPGGIHPSDHDAVMARVEIQ